MLEELKSKAQEFFRAVSKRSFVEIDSLLTDDSTYAAIHRGIVANAKEYFRVISAKTFPTIQLQFKKVISEGDTVCLQFESEAVNEGRRYYNYGVFILTFKDGKVKSIVEYADSLRYLVFQKRYDTDVFMDERLQVPYP